MPVNLNAIAHWGVATRTVSPAQVNALATGNIRLVRMFFNKWETDAYGVGRYLPVVQTAYDAGMYILPVLGYSRAPAPGQPEPSWEPPDVPNGVTGAPSAHTAAQWRAFCAAMAQTYVWLSEYGWTGRGSSPGAAPAHQAVQPADADGNGLGEEETQKAWQQQVRARLGPGTSAASTFKLGPRMWWTLSDNPSASAYPGIWHEDGYVKYVGTQLGSDSQADNANPFPLPAVRVYDSTIY